MTKHQPTTRCGTKTVDFSILENEWHAPDGVEIMKLHVKIFDEEAHKADDPQEAAKAQDAEWMPRGLPQACFPEEWDRGEDDVGIFVSSGEDESKEGDDTSQMQLQPSETHCKIKHQECVGTHRFP